MLPENTVKVQMAVEFSLFILCSMMTVVRVDGEFGNYTDRESVKTQIAYR